MPALPVLALLWIHPPNTNSELANADLAISSYLGFKMPSFDFCTVFFTVTFFTAMLLMLSILVRHRFFLRNYRAAKAVFVVKNP